MSARAHGPSYAFHILQRKARASARSSTAQRVLAVMMAFERILAFVVLVRRAGRGAPEGGQRRARRSQAGPDKANTRPSCLFLCSQSSGCVWRRCSRAAPSWPASCCCCCCRRHWLARCEMRPKMRPSQWLSSRGKQFRLRQAAQLCCLSAIPTGQDEPSSWPLARRSFSCSRSVAGSGKR